MYIMPFSSVDTGSKTSQRGLDRKADENYAFDTWLPRHLAELEEILPRVQDAMATARSLLEAWPNATPEERVQLMERLREIESLLLVEM